ncbi:hypothetical protein [Streptomyces sp. NBC_01615]|uniref:hypothetical protein n=1 Tax=Streptomyces sp. NBC_01615 TaxID=2975898 RepID=UPI0038650639
MVEQQQTARGQVESAAVEGEDGVPAVDRAVVAGRRAGAADTNGFIAVRTKAWDADGNTVEQTVLRAYALK